MKIPMSQIHAETAEAFARSYNFTPSHCDVRCFINDSLDSYEKDGHRVYHGYSQDRAFKQVREALRLIAIHRLEA